MPNLQVVSLSMNKISSLEIFQSLAHLKELYLRKNAISDIWEINYLSELHELEILWLRDNPVEHHRLYRLFTIKTIKSLKKLDDTEVTYEER